MRIISIFMVTVLMPHGYLIMAMITILMEIFPSQIVIKMIIQRKYTHIYGNRSYCIMVNAAIYYSNYYHSIIEINTLLSGIITIIV